MKIFKVGLLGLLIVFALIVGVISYFMATFDPNVYKPQIIQAVKDKQQRALKLDGDIQLTFFPNIGAKFEKISLSEYKSNEEFATVESARVSLALLPLVFKQVVVNELALSGVKVQVVKFRDGSSNLDDLMTKPERKPEAQLEADSKPAVAFQFDIAGVKIENTQLNYRDESTGAQYALKDINLKTGRIANGVPGKISLEMLVQANKPKLDIATKIQATFTFDLEKQACQIEGLDLQIKGTALDISNLLVQASGSANANLATLEFETKKFRISANGVKGKDNFDATLDMPAFSFTKDKVAADKLAINVSMDGAMGKLIAVLTLHDMNGNAQSFKSSSLVLDVDLKQPEQALKLKMSTPLAGSIEAKQINLSNLVIAVNATGDTLPNKSVSSEMRGSVQIDAERESIHLNLAGGLLQSQVEVKLAVKGFSEPAIRFNVDIDQLDADLYLPNKSAATSVKDKAEPAPEQPFDLSALKKLNLDGSLNIGTLKVANVKSSKLRVDVKARNGQVNLSPLSANLYQGSINGSIAINATKATPTFTLNQNLSGVQLGPLIKDALGFDIVEGTANVSLNLTTQGNMVSELKKGLSGTAALNMTEGAIKGINLSKLIQGAQNLGKGTATLKPVAGDKTEFTDLKASFKVNKGVARNDDLLLKSQSLRVIGRGDIDIGNGNINYATKATLAESVDAKSGSVTIPVEILGPFADLKFKVDYGAVVRDVIKQKVDAKIESKKEKLKQQLQEKLKGNLKDLFK